MYPGQETPSKEGTMSNPVIPGQPYTPQGGTPAPSAGSAPVYASYQAGQAQPGAYSPAPGYPSAPSGPAAGAPMSGAPVPGAPVAMAPAGPSADSLFTNLFDTTRVFAQKYGNILLILGAVGYLGSWFFGLITSGMLLGNEYSGNTAVVNFISQLLPGLLKACVELFILRLIIEIAANLGKDKN